MHARKRPSGDASPADLRFQRGVPRTVGGNAFLPALFLLAALFSGAAVLPHAQKTDIYLTALGVLLTTVYICGLILRPRRWWLGMGADSLAVLTLYAVGLAGLMVIALDAPV